MTTIGLIYLLIKIIEIIVLYFVGINIETHQKKYWRYALWAILIYAIVEGLRWGHMVDYNGYYYKYQNITTFADVSDNSSPAFALIVYFLKQLNINYHTFIFIQCAFLMYSCMYFLKDYRKMARYTLPCMIIALAMNENFIRTYLGISFFLFGFSLFLNRNHKMALLFFVISLLTHFACGFMIPFVMLKPLLSKAIIKPFYTTLFILFTTFFVSISSLSILVDISHLITSIMGGTDHLALDYLNSMDRIIMGEGGAKLGISNASYFSHIKTLLWSIPMLFVCYNKTSQISNGIYLYNLIVIGLIIYPVFSQVELLGRFTEQLLLYCPIFLGYMMTVNNESKERPIPSILNIVTYLSIFVYMYGAINRPFVMEDSEMYFIWDSNGQPVNSRY